MGYRATVIFSVLVPAHTDIHAKAENWWKSFIIYISWISDQKNLVSYENLQYYCVFGYDVFDIIHKCLLLDIVRFVIFFLKNFLLARILLLQVDHYFSILQLSIRLGKYDLCSDKHCRDIVESLYIGSNKVTSFITEEKTIYKIKPHLLSISLIPLSSEQQLSDGSFTYLGSGS